MMQTPMKRILILGSGGAGKSTLARRLGNIIQIDVIHLDSYFWNAGWIETPKKEWQQIVCELASRDTWIMDGNYSGTLDMRLALADTIIFVDQGRIRCLWRIFKRRWQYAGRTRPDLAPDCPERLNWEFIKWVWNYPRTRRPAILQKIHQVKDEKRVLHLKGTREVKRFLKEVEKDAL